MGATADLLNHELEGWRAERPDYLITDSVAHWGQWAAGLISSGRHFGADPRGQPARHEVRIHARRAAQECLAVSHETAVHDGGIASAAAAGAAVRVGDRESWS
jgi:hypothetical protein